MEDYRSWKPADVRLKIRDGEITGPTPACAEDMPRQTW